MFFCVPLPQPTDVGPPHNTAPHRTAPDRTAPKLKHISFGKSPQ